MTQQILKYNTYRNILPGKRGGFSLRGRVAAVRTPDAAIMALAMRASLVLIFILAFVYVAEKSAMVFSQRTALMQEQSESTVGKTVSDLEVAATQMQAAHNLTEVAAAENMVIPQHVSYLNVDGDAVALAR